MVIQGGPNESGSVTPLMSSLGMSLGGRIVSFPCFRYQVVSHVQKTHVFPQQVGQEST